MEIEKTAKAQEIYKNGLRTVKIGSLLRVRVLRRLGKGSFLVEFKGENHIARMDGKISSKMFLAKVIKLSPKIELKFMRDLDGDKTVIKSDVLEALLTTKKSFIQKLISTDNFFVNLNVLLQKDKKVIKESIQKSIRNQNVLQLMHRGTVDTREIVKYYVLQNIYNLLNCNSSIFLFPLKVGERNYPCDLRIFGGGESANSSFFLTLYLENERKIEFLVFIDYELISCTIATNSSYIESRIKSQIDVLIHNLKALKFDREIKVHFIPYSESNLLKFNALKKIDIKM